MVILNKCLFNQSMHVLYLSFKEYSKQIEVYQVALRNWVGSDRLMPKNQLFDLSPAANLPDTNSVAMNLK